MMSGRHEVVISGIGGKLPDCSSLAEFQEKLFTSQALFRPDTDRWNEAVQEKPFFTGKIPDWNRFDNAFFGIPGKLLNNCDPMMGLMLESCFEAMVDAGVNPFLMKGRNVSVVSASSNSDAETLRITGGVFLDGTGMVGHSRTMMANRVSYFFDLSGPSYSMDSSWASAAAGLQKASLMVASGEVESALVVSCNLVTHNAIDKEYSELKWLTENGECRPFDAAADGFARSEGVVCMFVQRSSQAKRRYCSLVKSRVSFLGDRPGGFLHLGDPLRPFLHEFYADTGVKPEQVGYVEASGFGVLKKDADELNAISRVFKGKENSPLLVGAVSGNVGTTDALSAFVSLAKAVVAMETGLIPPTVHFHDGNPDVKALSTGELKIATEATALKSDFVAINNVTFHGTASHILVERNSRTKPLDSPADGLPRLVMLQARHEQGAKQVVDKIKSIPLDAEYISMVNDVFKTPVPAYLWRGYAIVPSNDIKQNVQAIEPVARPVWWVFSGMGSQWPAMGRELLALPAFAAAVARCDRALRPEGVDLTQIVGADEPALFDNIVNCFVGIAAIQVGLVDVLRSVGVCPAGIVGHSTGELGCAYADGCFTAEQTVLAAYARGRASAESDVIPGMMAAVGLGYSQIKDQVPESIDIACRNAPDSCTLSGPTEDVLRYVTQLKDQGVFAKAVSAGGIAYHSRYIKEIAPKLLGYMKQVVPEPRRRSPRWISSSVPESRSDAEEALFCSAEYHTNNLLNPVLFEEACKRIPTNAIVIEIAPRGLMQAILRRSLGQDSLSMSLTSRQAESNIRHLLNCIGQLFLHNVAVDVNALYPPVQYPVSRGTPGLAELVTWDHDNVCYQDYMSLVHMIINERKTQKVLNVDKQSPDFILWKERCVHGQVVVPFAQLMIYTWEMFAKQQLDLEEMSVVIEDAVMVEDLSLKYGQSEINKTALISFLPNTRCFEISVISDDKMKAKNILTGKLHKRKSSPINLEEVEEEEMADMEQVEGEEIYQNLAKLGLELGSEFQLIRKLSISSSGYVAKVEWTGNLVSFLDSLFNIAVFLKTDTEQELHLPSSVTKLAMDPEFLKSISTGTVVDVQYDRVTDTLACSGIEISGLALRRAPPPTPPALKCTEMKLQPYFDTNLSFQELVSASVRLASEAGLSCWANKSQVTALVVNGHTNSPSPFTKLLQDSFKQEKGMDLAVREVDLAGVRAALPSVGAGVLVATDSALLPALSEAVPRGCQLYCLVRLTVNGNATHHKLYKPILVSQGKHDTFVLVKRVENNTAVKMYELDASNWLDGLRKLISSVKEDASVVVISRKHSHKTILPQLALEPYANRLRTMFLPESALGVSLKSPLYKDQLALNLPVSVMSNGVWNFIKPTSTLLKIQENQFDAYFKSNKTQITVDCIGLNSTTHSNDERLPNKIDYVDYSGSKNGLKVMGFGRVDAASQRVSPDPWLQWPVPPGWSMEDAATVPVAYSLAYYCVHLKAGLQPGDRVLVTAPLSPVGQAVVGVALRAGAVVFAHVNDHQEASKLLKLFPTLVPSHVLERAVGSNVNVAVRKLARGGVDLVVNCLRGGEMQVCLQALAFRGTFIHLGRISVEDRESVGMLTFLKNTSFYGVNLNNIENSCEIAKQRIQEFITTGIRQGHVKPLNRMCFARSIQDEGWKHFLTNGSTEKTVILRKEQKSISPLIRSVQYNPDQLCILAGPSAECSLSVAKWLATQGATKFVILSEEEREGSCCNRQLNRLVNQQGCVVFLSSLHRLDGPEEADELFKEINRIGTVTTIFFVSLDDCRARTFEKASGRFNQDVRFVSLLCNGASKGTTVKVGGTVTSVNSLLPFLPSLLADSKGHARCLVVEDVESSDNKCESGRCRLPLPRTVDQLASLCGAFGDHPAFQEVATLSPGLRHVRRDLLPVFLVPATSPASLQPLAGRLTHPAFCSDPPASMQSVDQHAQDLMKDLLRVQSKGPMNLVGDSWSGPVALRLAVLLEAEGHQVELILLEGLPSVVKAAIQALGETSKDIEATLVSTCDLLNDENAPSAQAQTSALHRLVAQLTAVTHFRPTGQLFEGHVTLVTAAQPDPADLDDLSLYCKQTPRIILTGSEDREQLIAKTSAAINENVAFTWDT